jgi:hypothetical protein
MPLVPAFSRNSQLFRIPVCAIPCAEINGSLFDKKDPEIVQTTSLATAMQPIEMIGAPDRFTSVEFIHWVGRPSHTNCAIDVVETK